MPTMTTLVDGTVPVAADFNGNYAALNAAIGTGTTIAAYTTGDMLYASASNTLARRAIGSAGQVLTVSAGVPQWAAAAGLTSQITGLGLARTSGTSVTVAVGAAASDDATLANRILLSLTAALLGNTTGTWVVGNSQPKLDAGAVGNNQWWHVFVIERTDTGVVDILFSLSPTAPTLPTSYSKQRRVGSFKTDGAAAILDFAQDGDYFRWLASVLDVNSTNPGTSAVTATLTVPTGVRVFWMGNIELRIIGSNSSALLSDLAANDEAPVVPTGVVAVPGFTVPASSGGSVVLGGASPPIRTNTSAQFRTRLSASDANTVLGLVTLGWIDRRGQDS